MVAPGIAASDVFSVSTRSHTSPAGTVALCLNSASCVGATSAIHGPSTLATSTTHGASMVHIPGSGTVPSPAAHGLNGAVMPTNPRAHFEHPPSVHRHWGELTHCPIAVPPRTGSA